MKKIVFTSFFIFILTAPLAAQDTCWTLNDCMRYAIENSPKVKQKQYTNDTYKAEQQSAIGQLFPSIGASLGATFNYGRSIDPATNTYNNTSTFNNGYGLSAQLPLFNGGVLINNIRLANVNKLLGKQLEQKEKDDLALSTMEAFMTVLYYRGTLLLAKNKVIESSRTLYKTKRMEELGLKGKADVAQVEALAAADEYNLTHQENLYETALLTLKQQMNYPSGSVLVLDTLVTETSFQYSSEAVDAIYEQAVENNPVALQAALNLKGMRLNHTIAKGRLYPSISFSAGISTNYFENLASGSSNSSFGSQFKNNRGEYFSFNVSVPIFDGLSKLTNLRRARNNVRIAIEQQNETYRQLQIAIEQAVMDREGYAREMIQKEKEVKANELAYNLTLRKYEEGLMSPLDLQTSANTLLLSQADLLQRRLQYIIKCYLVDYYKGEPLVFNE